MSFLNYSDKGKPLPVSKIPEYPQYGNQLQVVNKLINLIYTNGITPSAVIDVQFPVSEIRIKQICASTAEGVYRDQYSNAILSSNLVGNNPLGFVSLTSLTPTNPTDLRYIYKTPIMISGVYDFPLTDLLGAPVVIPTVGDNIFLSLIIEFVSSSSAKDFIQNVSS